MANATNESCRFKYDTLRKYTNLEDHAFLQKLIAKTEKKFFRVTRYYDILENFDYESEARKQELVNFVEAEPITFKQKITNILKLN